MSRLVAVFLVGAITLASAPAASAPVAADPNLFLEQVDGARALATVKQWNAKTVAALEKQPGFADYRARALALLSTNQKIAEPDQVLGNKVLNFWQDEQHPRGLWRVSPLADFASGRPQWRTLLDIDAMSKADSKKWVFKGATCLSPAYADCMVSLSNGGGDAVEVREFDLDKGSFVAGGFAIPNAKTDVSWAGPDAVFVGTDFGPGTLTDSGYPRIVKLWRRGTPLSAARMLAEGAKTDVSVNATSRVDGDRTWQFVTRGVDFYHRKVSHIAPDGRLVPTLLPDDADIVDVLDGRVIASLKTPWRGHPAGALVAYSIPDLLSGKAPAIEAVFLPNGHQAVEEVSASKSRLWAKILDDVSGRLIVLGRAADGSWSSTSIALPDKSTVHLNAAASNSDLAFATVEGMLTPPTLFRIEPSAPPTAIQALPAQFDASNMVVEQHFATSSDGTRIPYFLVHRKDVTGPVGVLMHAYGGFELAQTPTYLVHEPYRSGPLALFWVQEGNAYVLANIRGGGEYGPSWHNAVLRENRQKAYDDLYAVADDLVARNLTQKGRLAVSGRSNGGLMASVAITERPDLWGGAIIGSPLVDMKRYSHLLAGASWMGEYGNPDVPADWAFISKYSPYQKLRCGIRYPTPFIYTSTRDDRVHPGHARKLAAKLEHCGDPFYYDEAIEGGHAAGIVPEEDAQRVALETVYLNLVLPRQDQKARPRGERGL
ncbi:prolyl oligopeptidase family serine peptidase [Sphingomonas agri]|uniref:prolyl oligopeptidase family serine peptidase n=1 Tax=Sphingomonas agri TaxID=1813878 RepID=UPI00311F9F34